MKKFSEYSIPLILLTAAAFGLVLGAFLPFYRAQVFNGAQNSLPEINNLDEFKNVFNNAFDSYTPVGDEELSRFTANVILKIISQPHQPEDDSRAIVDYAERHLLDGDIRHTIAIGQMRLVLWENFRKEDDFKKSEDHYLRALTVGPKLPMVLYGLLDLYKSKDDKEKLNSIATKIIALWPNDTETRSFLFK